MKVARVRLLRHAIFGLVGPLFLGTVAAASVVHLLRQPRPPYQPALSATKPAPDHATTLRRLKHTKCLTYRRHRPLTDDELSEQLSHLTELRFDNLLYPEASRELAIQARNYQDEIAEFPPKVLLEREDLRVLPLKLDGFRLDDKDAADLLTLSRSLRVQLDACKNSHENEDPSVLREHLARSGDCWQQASAVSALEQILQGEEKAYRLLMIEALGRIDDRKASIALARSALFDVAEEVRKAATQELAERSFEEYRAVLLSGFRYPWRFAGTIGPERANY